MEVSVTAENRIRGMIELRECVRRLIEYQTEGYPDEDIAAEQQKLNVLYDSFTAKYGLINSRGNKLAFSEAVSYTHLKKAQAILGPPKGTCLLGKGGARKRSEKRGPNRFPF